MNAPTGKWERLTHKYASGERYVIGKINVATAAYDSMASKGEPARYKINIDLPGLKPQVKRYGTLESAKADAERVVDVWFKALSL